MFVKQAVLASFRDGSAMIRSAAGQDIVALMAALEPRNWPEALSALVTMLDEGSVEQQEVRQLESIMFTLMIVFGNRLPSTCSKSPAKTSRVTSMLSSHLPGRVPWTT